MRDVATDTPDKLLTRVADPLNLEMPFSTLKDFVTPNESFYVRCHFPVPAIAPDKWRLRLEGALDVPLEFSLDELRQMPSRTICATLECAGNGRSFLEPKVRGVPWGIGAVGTAEWTGVLLGDLLRRARLQEGVREVVLEGADKGGIKETPRPPGEINYARSLPIEKAMENVLLAYDMNAKPLSATHGFPLRAVVPGWFGMASVKWLQRIVVSAKPFNGYYQTIDYSYWADGEIGPELVPLGEMQTKAQIARPESGETIAAGISYRVHGAAWAGAAQVASVEISVDGGSNWTETKLLGEAVEGAWRFWEFEWQTPEQPGKQTLLARATDSAGHTQPRERAPHYGTYVVNHWLPIEVEVR